MRPVQSSRGQLAVNRIESLIFEYEVDREGFSKWFTFESLVETTPLGDGVSISGFILGNPTVQDAIGALGEPLDFAVMGWLDNAVLMVMFTCEGPSDNLRDAAHHLETLEVEESGDSALLVTRNWWDLLLVYVSEEKRFITVDRLRRQPIPAPSYRLIHPGETELVGHWSFEGGQCVADRTCKRIEFLLGHYLVEVAGSPKNWTRLFRDPMDQRFWELIYPHGEMHGGGPPTLRCVPSDRRPVES